MGEPGELLAVSVERQGSTAVIRLDGELDMSTSPSLTAALDGLVADHVAAVQVDGSGLRFVDSSGLDALVRGLQRAREANVTFRVAKLSESLERLLDMTDLREVLAPGC